MIENGLEYHENRHWEKCEELGRGSFGTCHKVK